MVSRSIFYTVEQKIASHSAKFYFQIYILFIDIENLKIFNINHFIRRNSLYFFILTSKMPEDTNPCAKSKAEFRPVHLKIRQKPSWWNCFFDWRKNWSICYNGSKMLAYRLHLNRKKTKEMVVDRSNNNSPDLQNVARCLNWAGHLKLVF